MSSVLIQNLLQSSVRKTEFQESPGSHSQYKSQGLLGNGSMACHNYMLTWITTITYHGIHQHGQNGRAKGSICTLCDQVWVVLLHALHWPELMAVDPRIFTLFIASSSVVQYFWAHIPLCHNCQFALCIIFPGPPNGLHWSQPGDKVSVNSNWFFNTRILQGEAKQSKYYATCHFTMSSVIIPHLNK